MTVSRRTLVIGAVAAALLSWCSPTRTWSSLRSSRSPIASRT
jgi:hypothetical protein